MKGIKTVNLEQLLDDIVFVREIAKPLDMLTMINNTEVYNDCTLYGLGITPAHRLIQGTGKDKHDVVKVRWCTQQVERWKTLIIEAMYGIDRSRAFLERALEGLKLDTYLQDLSSTLAKDSVTNSVVDQMASSIVDAVRSIAKWNNAMYANPSQSLDALLRINGVTDNATRQSIIKDAMTTYTQSSSIYLYRTRFHIENHYDELRRAERLTSCMTHGEERLNYNHYINGKFFAPIQCWNDLDDVQLGLVSDVPPEQIVQAESYPFKGRTILRNVDGRWDNTVRYYGNERMMSAIQTLERVNLDGVKLRVYKSDTDRWIMPYIDGDYNVVYLTNEDNVDQEGRPFRWATVMADSRHSIGSHSLRKIPTEYWKNILRIDTDSWLAREIGLSVECAITGVSQYLSSLVYAEEFGGWVLPVALERIRAYGNPVRTNNREFELEATVRMLSSLLDESLDSMRREIVAYIPYHELVEVSEILKAIQNARMLEGGSTHATRVVTFKYMQSLVTAARCKLTNYAEVINNAKEYARTETRKLLGDNSVYEKIFNVNED